MNVDHNNSPCELILKIGCNEYDEISTAITSLLRSCSITEQTFFSVDRQIQPTTYFGSFTPQSLTSKIPIQCQSLSCVLFIKQREEKKDLFKNLWNFHHKIELLDEYNQKTIARQDYYELSRLLPLWSISSVPYNRQGVVRFNIFTENFDRILIFYKDLFQRKPDSSKSGFVLFNLSSSNTKLIYQFSIKYSPSIQPYKISQGAYLKFRLNYLNDFIKEYSSKLFTINKFEYYIYDPDGNLLHLHLYNSSSSSLNIKENISSKPFIYTNDSGICDSSDLSVQLLNSTRIQNLKQIYSFKNDRESYSSNDSGRWSSISSNELNTKNRAVHYTPTTTVNNISVSSVRKSDKDHRLKQQEKTVHPRIALKHQQQWKSSVYDSEPRLSNITCLNNRYYSSMNDFQKPNQIRPLISTNHSKTILSKNSNYNNCDISYDVDSPCRQSETLTKPSSFGYLNAFLMKKQQQLIHSQNVKQLIAQFDRPTGISVTSRPKSAPIIDQSKPTSSLLQRPINGTITPMPNKSSQIRSKSVTFNRQNDTSSADEDLLDYKRSPPINIGITLDSRLRRTPVFDMLRSTTMKSDIIEPKQFNRTNSLRYSFVPIARF